MAWYGMVWRVVIGVDGGSSVPPSASPVEGIVPLPGCNEPWSILGCPMFIVRLFLAMIQVERSEHVPAKHKETEENLYVELGFAHQMQCSCHTRRVFLQYSAHHEGNAVSFIIIA